MPQISHAVIWCSWQVAAVALFGLIASWISLRLRPALTSSLVCSTIVVIVAISLAAPFPLPAWLVWEAPVAEAKAANPSAAQPRGHSPAAVLGRSARDSDSAAALPLDWRRLVDRLRRLAAPAVEQPRRFSLVPGLIATIVVLNVRGGLRLIAAFRFAWKVRRSSRMIDHRRVHDISRALAARIFPGRQVQLREAEELSSAAVLGWLDPMILLPSDWRRWSPTELQSVLAHELAHVARYDSVWRAVSCVVTAVHYYNPLVHLLTRRIALTQELTADAVATRIVGRNEYVRAMSSLALRRDDQEASLFQAGLHPVFSGYLIRRIKMLQTRSDLGAVKEWAAARLMGVLLITVLGVLTFAARGVSQMPEPAGHEPAKPQASDAEPQSAEKSTEAADPTHGMFRRGATDLSRFPENDLGVIKVQLAEILRRPEAKPVETLINRLSAEALKKAFKSPELPTFDISSIDTVIGTAQMATRYLPHAEGPQKNTLQFGVSNLEVRFKRVANLSGWLKKFAPTTKKTQRQGRTYFTLPTMPAMGPAPLAVAARDLRTVCFSNTMWRGIPDADDPAQIDGLVKFVTHRARPNQSAWAKAFHRVDGGLVVFVATNKEIRTPREFTFSGSADGPERVAAEAFHRLEHTFQTLAVGIDLSEQGNRVGFRIRIGCANRTDAKTMESDFRLLHRLGLEAIEAASEADEDEELDAIVKNLSRQFMQRMVIGIEDHADGSSEVSIKTVVSHPSLLKVLAQEFLRDFEDAQRGN